MLKHVIDGYNYLLDIADTLKLRLTTMVALLALIIAGASLLTTQALNGASNGQGISGNLEEAQAAAQAAPKLSEQNGPEAANDKKAVGQASGASEAASKQAPSDTRQPSTGASSKDSVPPKIERNGQVAAGTLLSADSSKGEKIYYGGDLLFSVASLTVSKSDASAVARLTINAPGEAVVNIPVVDKDDVPSHFTVSADGSETAQSGQSFAMVIETAVNTPVGTYQLHVSTSKAGQSIDSWVYHGFLTINVVE
jgi:hypothetical protein